MVPVIEALETHSAIGTRMWGSATTRPTGYPRDLPFLASHPVTMLAVGDSHTVAWEKVPESTCEGISHELILDGWQETRLPGNSTSGVGIRIFRRGGRQRVMVQNVGQLTLLDSPVD